MKRLLIGFVVAAVLTAGCAAADDIGALPTDPSAPANDTSSDSTLSSPTIEPGDGVGDGTEGVDLPDDPALPPGKVVTPSPSPEVGTPGAAPASAVEAAITDLATRVGLRPTDVTVVAADSVTWPSGALGCPRPGMLYTMALVDGYRIVLAANGRDYAYHGSLDGSPFLCELPISGGSNDG